MRYSAEQKQEARARIVQAAGRAFRRAGYSGVGVDGLAKEAGVTSGAFYGHFRSKDAAFKEISRLGLEQLHDAIADLQKMHGAQWVAPFIDLYLGELRECDLGESCALQSLATDIMRADHATKSQFELGLQKVVALVSSGIALSDPALQKERAIALLALLSGGVTMARSVNDAKSASLIADHVRSAALHLCDLD